MRLGDLVWRGSLRNRAARDIEVASNKTFEATDLTIPAGTAFPYLIGDLGTFPAQRVFTSYVFLSVNRVLTATESLVLELDDAGPRGGVGAVAQVSGVSPNQKWSDARDASPSQFLYSQTDPPPETIHFQFNLWGNVEADVVVNLRAAFNVL